MNKKILIIGGSGFVAGHLVARLAADGCELFLGMERGVRLRKSPYRQLACDLRDAGEVLRTIAKVAPDCVFLMAGIAHLPTCEDHPELACEINLLGVLRVVNALKKAAPNARLIFPSSAVVYGDLERMRGSVCENRPPKPAGVYACTKHAAEIVIGSAGIDAVIFRPANHFGPGQSGHFVCAALAAQIARIKQSGQRRGIVRAGNLDVYRDFTDVRDIVRAYGMAIDRAITPGVYNLCSGRSVLVSAILEKLIEISGVDVSVRRDAALVREERPSKIRLSSAKFGKISGWAPEYSLDESLHDLLEYQLGAS